MKKLVATTLLAAMSLTLAACGSDKTAGNNEQTYTVGVCQ